MHMILDLAMGRRGARLADLLTPHLPHSGRVLDIGAGTGHNAVALRRSRPLQIVGLDVVDMHVVGDRPALFDGDRLPFTDDSYDAALVLFVLQYSRDPVRLLREVRRVCRGPILVLQSTYAGRMAEAALRLYDLAWGPLAFAVARATKLITTRHCSLYARVLTQHPALLHTFAQAGLRPELVYTKAWPILSIRRNLFVLERTSLPVGAA